MDIRTGRQPDRLDRNPFHSENAGHISQMYFVSLILLVRCSRFVSQNFLQVLQGEPGAGVPVLGRGRAVHDEGLQRVRVQPGGDPEAVARRGGAGLCGVVGVGSGGVEWGGVGRLGHLYPPTNPLAWSGVFTFVVGVFYGVPEAASGRVGFGRRGSMFSCCK